jgi:hypothetical protein
MGEMTVVKNPKITIIEIRSMIHSGMAVNLE